MTKPIRIRAVDDLQNVAYVHQTKDGRWRCTLANGIPASFSYAGFKEDEMAVRFALDDTSTPEEALQVAEQQGSPRYTYSLI